ncbi:MAG: hypothetical protein ACOC6C_00910 [Verrucomicrobiota bacterium]
MWFWNSGRKEKADRQPKTQVGGEDGKDFDLVESLQTVASEGGLAPEDLFLSILFEPERTPAKKDRSIVLLGNGQKIIDWSVESLSSLFRGDHQPPPVNEMEHYPERYVPFFYRIEYNVCRYCRTMDLNPTDAEFLDIYSQMRRRPDGRSTGDLHDMIWQSAALVLGLRPWSEAEYCAVFGQLARSARHFKMGSASRNYIGYIRGEMDR